MKNYYKQQKTEEKHSGIYAFLIVENSGHQSGYQSVTYDETLKLKEILSMDDSDNHPDCLPFRIPETINTGDRTTRARYGFPEPERYPCWQK